MLDYIDKNYSTRKWFMCGAMKTVSLLFDQPTYMYLLFEQENLSLGFFVFCFDCGLTSR